MNNVISRNVNDRIVGFKPIHRQITGSITCAILLSELLYLDMSYEGKEFYKTNEWLMNKCCLSKHEFELAKKKLKDLGIIEVVLRQVPAKSFYTISYDIYNQLMSSENEYILEDLQLDTRNPGNLLPEHSPDTRNPGAQVPGIRETTNVLELSINKTPLAKARSPLEKKSDNSQPTRLSEETELSDEWRDVAEECGVHPGWVDHVFDEFKSYWCYEAQGKSGKKSNWNLTWKNNCIRASDRYSNPPKNKSSHIQADEKKDQIKFGPPPRTDGHAWIKFDEEEFYGRPPAVQDLCRRIIADHELGWGFYLSSIQKGSIDITNDGFDIKYKFYPSNIQLSAVEKHLKSGDKR